MTWHKDFLQTGNSPFISQSLNEFSALSADNFQRRNDAQVQNVPVVPKIVSHKKEKKSNPPCPGTSSGHCGSDPVEEIHFF